LITHPYSRELNHVPVLSILLPLDLSLEYNNIPTISSIDEKITFPGGINKPKLVTITDSHGDIRRQLVKGGRDDLRQDTVMQQFFRICNAFLQDSKPTASRNLSILTFNALPFSPSSGLLEWIDNTDTIGRFIADGNSQFNRSANQAFAKLVEAQTVGKDAGTMRSKRALFEQCIKIVGPPRMRKVFLRRFPDPGSWFEARLAYTRSVAVNSMAGHIVGLGDRHLSNILMSKSTAEVVHIDLGIAFDQGKLLATPEQVPFRLTRNMVDGMGATGVEGVMRRCCEETLRVLRKHKDPLLAVLSVFIHDPLYKWALTYEKATKKQDNDQTQIVFSTGTSDVEGNVDANRTLLAIQHKLEGIIGGTHDYVYP
jgi:ataxia telangiectasia mutated family protein